MYGKTRCCRGNTLEVLVRAGSNLQHLRPVGVLSRGPVVASKRFIDTISDEFDLTSGRRKFTLYLFPSLF
jgi:hypothetical protein